MEDILSGDGREMSITGHLGRVFGLYMEFGTSKLITSFDLIISISNSSILHRLPAPSLDPNQQNSSSIIGNLFL